MVPLGTLVQCLTNLLRGRFPPVSILNLTMHNLGLFPLVLSPELQSLAQLCSLLRTLIPGETTGKGAALSQGRAFPLHFYKQEEKKEENHLEKKKNLI